MLIDPIISFLSSGTRGARLAQFALILISAWLLLILTRRFLLRWLAAAIRRTPTTYDDVLLKSSLFPRLAYLPPIILLYNFAYLLGRYEGLFVRGLTMLLVLVAVLALNASLSVISEMLMRGRPAAAVNIRSSIQISRIFIAVVGAVVLLSVALNKSPVVLLSGVGALTAVLLLVFRDTILSFIASLQISSYDIVQIGDWIEMPKYGADGSVVDIALHTVKVQNWDKTITVIPTHALVEGSFKNWRGMTASGGRRIKRAVSIDMSSVRFCSPEDLDQFERIQLLTEFIRTRRAEIKEWNEAHRIDSTHLVNGRRMTNLGVFRAYLRIYLKQHPKVKQDMTLIVRQLDPSPQGIPIEIYAFSSETGWEDYESLQADIFDHVLAVAPLFGLKVFQVPSGHDYKSGLDLLQKAPLLR